MSNLIDGGRCITGGYFFTKAIQRLDHMPSDLIPEEVLSACECLATLLPGGWTISWFGWNDEQRVRSAANLGITAQKVSDVVRWVTEAEELKRLCPGFFMNLETARAFAQEYRLQESVKLLGIGLPEPYRQAFLGTAVGNDVDRGIYARVLKNEPLTAGGRVIGYEPLAYECGSFHSWLCNGLEKEVFQQTGVRPGPFGLLRSWADAEQADRCIQQISGKEPGFWAPWLFAQYEF